jgi:hypothetical protein
MRAKLGPLHFYLLPFCLFVLFGCQGPSVFILHSPMQPSRAQPVTYTASAQDPDGVQSIEIWEDRNELGTCANGQPCGTPLATARLHTCTFTPPEKEASCAFTVTSGYPDRSLVGYRAVAADAKGNSATEGWIYYAAGRFPWPDQPIPIYATGPPAKQLDLIFIPDTDYGDDEQRFMDDVTRLIHEAYLSSAPFSQEIRPWRGYWNFYLTYQAAEVKGFDKGCYLPPKNWAVLRSAVNAGAVLHHKEARDCIGIGEGSLFSLKVDGPTSKALAVHHTAHSLFSLADEYCCDGGYWESLPQPNVFSSRARCRAYASARDWSINDCRQIGSPTFWRAAGMTGWWKLDADGDLMEQAGNLGGAFGTADRMRIRSLYFEACDGRGGC